MQQDTEATAEYAAEYSHPNHNKDKLTEIED